MHTPNPHYRRALLGVTLLPVVCFSVTLWVILAGIVEVSAATASFTESGLDDAIAASGGSAPQPDASFDAMLTLVHVAADFQKAGLAFCVALFFAYTFDVVRRASLTAEAKAGWFVAILFGNVLGMLVYWYVVIRRDDQRATLLATVPPPAEVRA